MKHPALLDYIEDVARTYAENNRWDDQQTADIVTLVREAMARYPDPRLAPGEKGVRVYIILDPRGPLKIGISNNPAWRAQALSAGNPRALGVVYKTRPYTRAYAMAVEASVHDHLAALSLGREWFDCSVDKAMEAIHLFGGIGE